MGATAFRAIRTLSLAVITIQNCSLMMVTSYSRSAPGPKYLSSTAVVAGELVKTLVVLGVLVSRSGPCGVLQVVRVDIFSKESHTFRYAVPALFYTVQNNLWYYAMSNLDSVTAAVMSQLKVPSTAIFSILILKRQLNRFHWFSLVLLVFGLIVMQLQSDVATQKGASISNYYCGLVAMVAACTSSGYAGVYLELLFKQLNADVWTANMQLQIFCLPIAAFTVVSDLEDLMVSGPFQGWDVLTCIVVFLNALGGFAVSLTMKYADNILKTFAVSMSLVLNCVLSWMLFSVQVTMQDGSGIVMVIVSSWLYSKAGTFPTSEAKYETISSEPDGSDAEIELSQPADEPTRIPTDVALSRTSIKASPTHCQHGSNNFGCLVADADINCIGLPEMRRVGDSRSGSLDGEPLGDQPFA